MSVSFVSLILPTHTTDIKVDDIDGDGQAEIVVVGKDNGTDVPSGISLYVYKEKGEQWEQIKKIKLGQKAIFWEVQKGVWGMDALGIRNLYADSEEYLIRQDTWLKGLRKASPKEADFVHDLNDDGENEFLLNKDSSLYGFSAGNISWGQVSIPVVSSIREYSKTGGAALEVAKRSAPVVVQDVDGDGIKDLIFLKSTQAEVHYSVNGMLGTKRIETIDLPINVEPQQERNVKKELSTVQFVDLNSDQKIDMIWRYWITGENRFGASSEIGWAFGHGSGFDEAQSFIQEQAIVDLQVSDVDSDGDQDLLLIGIDLGLGSLAAAMVSQSASVNLLQSRLDDRKFQNPQELSHFSFPIKLQDVLDYHGEIDINDDGQKDIMVLLIDRYIEYYRNGDKLEEVRNEKLEVTGGNFYLGCLACERPTVVIWKKGSVQAQIFHVK